MKLFLKIYSVIYALFCLYCFTAGCEKYHMKGEFEINFFGVCAITTSCFSCCCINKI